MNKFVTRGFTEDREDIQIEVTTETPWQATLLVMGTHPNWTFDHDWKRVINLDNEINSKG